MGKFLAEFAPKLSRNNRDAIIAADQVGCYFCIRVFTPSQITDYDDDGKTGLCPCCDTDTLLPNVTDTDTLVKCCERWFTKAVDDKSVCDVV